MLLGYGDETIQEVYVPIPSMAVVEYMTKGSQSTSKDGSRLLAHIASLRVLIKSKAHSAIIWEEDLLTPICRFPSLSKRLFSQTSSDLIVLYPGGGNEDYNDINDADDIIWILSIIERFPQVILLFEPIGFREIMPFGVWRSLIDHFIRSHSLLYLSIDFWT